MKKCLVIMMILLLPALLTAAPGDWRALGGSEWGQTIAGATLNGKLYTAESSGYLYVTDLGSGEWQTLSSGYGNTMFMFAANNYLYTIETDGSMYKVSPNDGSWSQIGNSGDWRLTIAGTILNGKLYTAESSGYLYETNLSTGQWREISTGYGNTKFMFADSGKLYTIETDGSLYEVSPGDGSWRQVGSGGAWVGTLAGAMLDGKLYTAEGNDFFYWTNPRTGDWTEIASGYGSTKFMFAANGKIYTIEHSGVLYEILVR